MTPRPNARRALRALGALTVAAGITAGAVAAVDPRDDGQATRHSPLRSTTPAALTAPATTAPDPAGAASAAAFPSASCARAALAPGSVLGLGIPKPARLSTPGPERAAFDAAVGCLDSVGGQTTALRTQLPIDAARRAGPGDDEHGELTAFARLLNAHGAQGVISVRSHDFAACDARSATPATEVTTLAPGAALTRCQYPSPALYSTLFSELYGAMTAAASEADVFYTAWNEPDHPMFTLQGAFGQQGAARRAGAYWARAAAIAGPNRVLAGEFADRDLPTLLRLRRSFVAGARTDPPAWAIHPYRDLTAADSEPSVVDGFTEAVAPAPVWLTEVTAKLSGRSGIGGDGAAQRARGAELRAALGLRPTRVLLYLLTPPPPPATRADDGWDSALADRQGRARPFICGLAGLPAGDCPGDAATYGG